jgi:hypothetical protein
MNHKPTFRVDQMSASCNGEQRAHKRAVSRRQQQAGTHYVENVGNCIRYASECYRNALYCLW